jgi:predicted unusual protein kinase regulating ubiquinone biosynthesis (AarF/ABC1/UbiB family)
MDSPRTKPIPGGRIGRVAPLVGLAGRTAGEAVVASLRKNRAPARSKEAMHARAAERYVQRLGHSRGVLMKAGQILSMTMPESTVEGDAKGVYQRAFAKLFDDAPPMPTRVAVATIERELARPLPEMFASFEPKPLAAASIGQVHAATLHDGTRVAVKVQYPGVEQAIRADLANTELLGTFLQLLLTLVPNLANVDVRGMTREISDRIGEEIDYLIEAVNQQEFADAYRGHPFIRIPEIHHDLTTRRVLTMQLIDGMRYAEARLADQQLRDQWAEAIFRFIYGSLGRLSVNNADPHPGNYLFHPDGTVTFLDFGCVKRLDRPQVDEMVEMVRLILAEDAEAMYRFTIRTGLLRPDAKVDPADLLSMLAGTYSFGTQPQPFTFTPELMAETWHSLLSGPNMRIARQLSQPPERTMLIRTGTGSFSVMGGLRATGYWRAILEECWFQGTPCTAYGELDAEFWAAKEPSPAGHRGGD